jgi:hypothetical protein
MHLCAGKQLLSPYLHRNDVGKRVACLTWHLAWVTRGLCAVHVRWTERSSQDICIRRSRAVDPFLAGQYWHSSRATIGIIWNFRNFKPTVACRIYFFRLVFLLIPSSSKRNVLISETANRTACTFPHQLYTIEPCGSWACYFIHEHKQVSGSWNTAFKSPRAGNHTKSDTIQISYSSTKRS